MAPKFPESYDDPLYDQVDTANERKLGIPVGLLTSIRTAGEKTNASRTSSAGATTPYQFIPATRAAILDKYGIDVTLSPDNASEGAGLLLKESLDRNKGDVESAVREYHGGTDRSNWGKINNAYAGRVLANQGKAKAQALDTGFAAFMKANPAIPAAAPAATKKPDALADGFGEWLKGGSPTKLTDLIPSNSVMYDTGTAPPPPGPAPIPEAPQTLLDKAAGTLEAGATVLTGATGGLVGTVMGTGKGLAQSVMDGTFGTQEGVRTVDKAAGEGMAALTYQPRTTSGQEQAGAVGEVMAAALPAFPLTAEMSAIGSGIGAVTGAARNAGSAGVQRIRTLAPGIADRVERTLRRNPLPEEAAPAAAEPPAPFSPEQATRLAQIEGQAAGTPSRRVQAADGTPLELPGTGPRRLTAAEQAELAELQAARQAAESALPEVTADGARGSGGSAGTDPAAQRRASAGNLPVPIRLTLGQATRNQEQLRFEGETAKGSLGEKLRQFEAEQNVLFHKNFEKMVDMTGAEALDLIEVGRSVDKAIVKEAARDKAEIRVAYKNAEKAGEMQAPVSLEALVDYLNESAPDAATAPILNGIRQYVTKLGIAQDKGGQLVMPKGEAPMFGSLMNARAEVPKTTLKTAETLRQAITRITDYEPTNIRQATLIKGLIDTATEGAGGAAYRSARRLRENFFKKYEDRAIVASLLNRKRGTADRKVALEDVFAETILNGSREDLSYVRRVLLTGGDEGKQAWKDLQGATITWLKDETLKNVATDQRGNRLVSAAQMEKSVRKLEKGGKLDFIFGKQGAQTVRDLNELAKQIRTTPPGTLNTSNTASVLLAAFAGMESTGALTGLPLPVLSSLRLLSIHVKNRKIQQRIEQALNHRPAPPAPPAIPPGSTLH